MTPTASPADVLHVVAEPTRLRILNLLKGTLRTFTGAIAQTNRDKFVMKTRVATVGIRGSGNILYACEGDECDASVTGGQPAQGPARP